MTEPDPQHVSAAGPPAPTGPAPAEPASTEPAAPSAWAAPAYDLHPPAQMYPNGPDGPSNFGGAASTAADPDQTSVLPAVGDQAPLVWPELHGAAVKPAPGSPSDQPAIAASASPTPQVEPLPSSSLITALQAISSPAVDAPALVYAASTPYSPMPSPSAGYDAPPPPPMPEWAPSIQRTRATQSVTCPQCGTVVPVDSQARSSLDFCPNPVCDFPLFWVKSSIHSDEAAYGEGSAHRRLPGTAGRAITSSMACPHCTELNPINGVLCVRCGKDLHPIAAAPPPPPPPLPEPVYVAQEIDDPVNWWLIILVGALIVLFFAGLTYIAVAYLVN